MKRLIPVFMAVGCMVQVHCGRDTTDSPVPQYVIEAPAVFMGWYGHSSLRIVTPDSVEVIANPSRNSIPGFYRMPDSLVADIVAVSHSHADHLEIQAVHGNSLIIKTAGPDAINSVMITGYLSEPNQWNGAAMESNIIFVFQIGEIRRLHLGENRNAADI